MGGGANQVDSKGTVPLDPLQHTRVDQEPAVACVHVVGARRETVIRRGVAHAPVVEERAVALVKRAVAAEEWVTQQVNIMDHMHRCAAQPRRRSDECIDCGVHGNRGGPALTEAAMGEMRVHRADKVGGEDDRAMRTVSRTRPRANGLPAPGGDTEGHRGGHSVRRPSSITDRARKQTFNQAPNTYLGGRPFNSRSRTRHRFSDV